jgi:flagellar biosynthesis chaperone FliJ
VFIYCQRLIFNGSLKVLEALTSPDVLNKIIPVLSEKIGETISTLIESEIQACVATHIHPLKKIGHKQEKIIEKHEQKMCKQFIQINTLERTIKDQSLAINEHEAELESLHKKMSELEIRLESQEQYSRRTSLRFHNIKVPVNERGGIIHPVNTDDLILDICNTLPGVLLFPFYWFQFF